MKTQMEAQIGLAQIAAQHPHYYVSFKVRIAELQEMRLNIEALIYCKDAAWGLAEVCAKLTGHDIKDKKNLKVQRTNN